MALPDLDTRTVLNVVEENFKRLDLKAFAIRMIYIGEHTRNKEEMMMHFRKTVDAVNACYCDINISGLLVVYDSYFIHVLEGSEDTVHRQIRFLFKKEEDWIEEMDRLEKEAAEAAAAAAAAAAAEEGAPEVITAILEEPTEKPERIMFRGMKVLMVYHSIQTRWFETWHATSARPPSLVGKLDVYGPLPEHMEQLRICLDKIFKLCRFANMATPLSFEGVSMTDRRISALPEVALLDFLLQSPHIYNLRRVANLHRRIDDYIFYFESVWPLPTHYTPRHLYKLKIDDSFVEPLPVMPWEMKKEVAEDEEGREEERSGSSSSD